MPSSLTPTEERILNLLSDGIPHTRQDLASCIDELAGSTLVSVHLCNIRKKLRPKGYDIVCETHGHEYLYSYIKRTGPIYVRPKEPFKKIVSHKIARCSRSVYFAALENLAIKIGVAIDVEKRLNGLGLISPYPLTLLGTIPSRTAFALERKIHKKFAHLHLRREWFKYSQEIISYATAVQPSSSNGNS